MAAGDTRGDVRMVHRDGSLRWISMQASLVRDEQGAPAYFIVQAEDLTERVRARESLSSARTLMQETLERVGGAFIAVDSDWRITQVNETAEELVGLPRASLLGRVLQEVVDPDLLAPLVDAIATTMTERQQTHIAEFPYPPRQAWLTLRAYATRRRRLRLYPRCHAGCAIWSRSCASLKCASRLWWSSCRLWSTCTRTMTTRR